MTARAWLVFGAVSVLSGSAFLLMKLAVGDLGPVAVAFARTALASAVLLPLAARTGALSGLRGRWRALLALGALEFAAPFLLVAAGTDRIASSLAGVFMAAGPLLIALFAVRIDASERVRGRRLAGLVVGLAGVVVLLGPEVRGGAGEAIGCLLVLAGSACFALGALVLRRWLGDVPPLGAVAAGLAVGAALLAVPALLSTPAQAPSSGALVAVLVLGAVQTAVNYGLFFVLVRDVGAGRASLTSYFTPAVAVVLGVAFLGEPLTLALVAGLVLVLAGSRVAAGGLVAPR